MNTRFRFLIIFLGALLVAATYSFPHWQPLIASEEAIDEGTTLRGLAPEIVPTFQALPPEQQAAYLALEDPVMAAAMANAALAPVTPLPEDAQVLPNMSGPELVAEGTFSNLDPIRQASGEVMIYQQADERKLLRLENFNVVNGPELRVVLSAHPQPTTLEEMMQDEVDIDLGELAAASGSQNYEVPTELDLDSYNSVVIYSRSLNVIYTTATLVK